MFMQALPPQPPSYNSIYSAQNPEKRHHSNQSRQSLATQSGYSTGRPGNQSTWSLRTRPSFPSLRNITTRSTARSSLRTVESNVDDAQPRQKWIKRVLSRSPTIADANENDGAEEREEATRTRGHEQQDASWDSKLRFEDGVPYSDIVTFIGRCFRGVNFGW